MQAEDGLRMSIVNIGGALAISRRARQAAVRVSELQALQHLYASDMPDSSLDIEDVQPPPGLRDVYKKYQHAGKESLSSDNDLVDHTSLQENRSLGWHLMRKTSPLSSSLLGPQTLSTENSSVQSTLNVYECNALQGLKYATSAFPCLTIQAFISFRISLVLMSSCHSPFCRNFYTEICQTRGTRPIFILITMSRMT